MIDLPHSTYYYQSEPATAALGDADLVQLIEDIHDVFQAMAIVESPWN